MKNLILILTLCVMAKVSFAEPTNPNLNSDLDFRFDSQYSESESERGVANAKPEIEVDKGDPVPSMDKKGNVRVKDSERDIASDEEVFEKVNDSGVQYWKY
jgi:hypothetical protein